MTIDEGILESVRIWTVRGHFEPHSSGVIGTLRARPHAMNAQRPPRSKKMGNIRSSLRERYARLAKTMNPDRQIAAQIVRTGLIRVKSGNTSPNAPINSEAPISRTMASGAAPVQAMACGMADIGVVACMMPAMANVMAKSTCVIHRLMCSPLFLGGAFVVISTLRVLAAASGQCNRFQVQTRQADGNMALHE